MTNLHSGLTLAIRPHPGDTNLLELGVEVGGGFYGIQLLKPGRFQKILDRAAAEQAAAAAAAPPPTPAG